MSYEELLAWQYYFERRPVGWREDDRTFKLLQVQGCKAKAGEIFPSLSSIYNRAPQIDEDGELDISGFKQSFLFQRNIPHF